MKIIINTVRGKRVFRTHISYSESKMYIFVSKDNMHIALDHVIYWLKYYEHDSPDEIDEPDDSDYTWVDVPGEDLEEEVEPKESISN